MLNEDCYRLLGIPPDANEKTIRKAYRDRSKELHPDVNPSANAAQQFSKLNTALITLLDPISRLKHDDHFGYNKNIRNQDANVKQRFSDFQKEKAENLVKEWSTDYEKAMGMREQQRLQHLAKHHRKMWFIAILMISFLVLAFGIVAIIIYGGFFTMP
jgi:curved DNA-binding protein CbpA